MHPSRENSQRGRACMPRCYVVAACCSSHMTSRKKTTSIVASGSFRVPESGPVTPESQVMGRNAFCSGHCFLPDGRLLVVGGQSNNVPPFVGWGSDHDVHIFDPMTESVVFGHRTCPPPATTRPASLYQTGTS